jgi:hypothetical protein
MVFAVKDQRSMSYQKNIIESTSAARLHTIFPLLYYVAS